MEIIGVILILIVIALFLYYFRWSRKEEMAQKAESGQKVTVIVKGAYSPNVIKTTVGEPLTIIFDRQEDSACSKKVIIDVFDISQELPDFGKKEITIVPKAEGEYSFTCEMGMYQGKIIAEK